MRHIARRALAAYGLDPDLVTGLTVELNPYDLADGWYDEDTGRYVIRVWVYARSDEEPADE